MMTTRMRQVMRLTLLLCAGCADSSSRVSTPLPASPAPPPRLAAAGPAGPAGPVGLVGPPSPPPAPEREFRGLWIASYRNLDWPSRPGLDATQQKAELTAILNRAVLLHLNAIILQVRPGCDALYDSKIEPWSATLTGTMGLAPKPYYDPLAFAVAECHKRGLELHAWFNPFRVRSREDKTPASKNFVITTHRELVRTAGDVVMLDPSDPRSRGYSLGVIMDVVHRYDIDGVHLDDYFYPYPVKGYKPADFPDNTQWQQYLKAGGKLSRGDWRRNHINTFVQEVYASIKKEKPWVKFGISPFGVWRPGHPAGVTAGLDSYDALFADSQAWLANGWVDYLSPQLYWPTDEKEHSFAALLQWWSAQNPRQRRLPDADEPDLATGGGTDGDDHGQLCDSRGEFFQCQPERESVADGHCGGSGSAVCRGPEHQPDKLDAAAHQHGPRRRHAQPHRHPKHQQLPIRLLPRTAGAVNQGQAKAS